MSGQGPTLRRASVLWFGWARITRGASAAERPVAVVEFNDTAAMERALNSGVADLDFADDTMAVVLDRKRVPDGEGGPGRSRRVLARLGGQLAGFRRLLQALARRAMCLRRRRGAIPPKGVANSGMK